jgi:hypothetical protein
MAVIRPGWLAAGFVAAHSHARCRPWLLSYLLAPL